jgi:hypothetical protein
VAWPARWPIQVCVVAGSSPWLVGLPPAVVELCGSSFRFCRVGRGWPTPVHGPGDRRRHDVRNFPSRQFFDATAATHASPIAAVVLSKKVLTVSTLTSAFLGAFVFRHGRRIFIRCCKGQSGVDHQRRVRRVRDASDQPRSIGGKCGRDWEVGATGAHGKPDAACPGPNSAGKGRSAGDL